MQDQPRIAAEQLRCVNAKRQIPCDARLRAARDEGLGFTRRPTCFSWERGPEILPGLSPGQRPVFERIMLHRMHRGALSAAGEAA